MKKNEKYRYKKDNINENLDRFLNELFELLKHYYRLFYNIRSCNDRKSVNEIIKIHSNITKKIDNTFQYIIGCGKPSCESYWSTNALAKITNGLQNDTANGFTRDHVVPKRIIISCTKNIYNQKMNSKQTENEKIELILTTKLEILDFLVRNFLIVVITNEENNLLNKCELQDCMPVGWAFGSDLIERYTQCFNNAISDIKYHESSFCDVAKFNNNLKNGGFVTSYSFECFLSKRIKIYNSFIEYLRKKNNY